MLELANTTVILNGPPDSGKDVIAKYISEKTGAFHSEFKEELYIYTAELFNVPLDYLKTVATHRDTKEDPTPILKLPRKEFNRLMEYLGRLEAHLNKEDISISPREALIYASELDAKPKYGKDYFGKKAAEKLSKVSGNVFSDGGFIDEIGPVAEKMGANNVFICRLHRKGKDFGNDSRDYLQTDNMLYTTDIHNEGTIEEAAETVLAFVRNIREQQELNKFEEDCITQQERDRVVYVANLVQELADTLDLNYSSIQEALAKLAEEGGVGNSA